MCFFPSEIDIIKFLKKSQMDVKEGEGVEEALIKIIAAPHMEIELTDSTQFPDKSDERESSLFPLLALNQRKRNLWHTFH